MYMYMYILYMQPVVLYLIFMAFSRIHVHVYVCVRYVLCRCQWGHFFYIYMYVHLHKRKLNYWPEKANYSESCHAIDWLALIGMPYHLTHFVESPHCGTYTHIYLCGQIWNLIGDSIRIGDFATFSIYSVRITSLLSTSVDNCTRQPLLR